ncbi:MAG: hypothetical protein ABIV43_03245, partial [Candidatus Saccharimonadales bacterium]
RIVRVFATRPVALFIRYGCLNRFVLSNLYTHMWGSKRRFIEVSKADFYANMTFEVELWQKNDVRTHWLTTSEFLRLDNCDRRINMPVWNVPTSGDQYFDNNLIEQHMRVVYTDYVVEVAQSKAHTPPILADKHEMSVLLPPKLRRALAKSPKPSKPRR